jgi:hypothetical protein
MVTVRVLRFAAWDALGVVSPLAAVSVQAVVAGTLLVATETSSAAVAPEPVNLPVNVAVPHVVPSATETNVDPVKEGSPIEITSLVAMAAPAVKA